MSELAAELLERGASENYRRWLALNLALLPELLRRGESGDSSQCADQVERALAPIERLPAADAVELGTPFFWLNVRRCQAEARGGDLRRATGFLLMTAFDAFFDRFPDGHQIELAIEEGEICLPRLAVRVPTSSTGCRLVRRSTETITVEDEGGGTEISLSAPPQAYQQAQLEIPGQDRVRLLLSDHPGLFDPDYIDDLAPATSNANGLAEMIAKALELIDTADPALHQRINQLINWYVPITAPDDPDVHHSFSATNLKGVIFLSEAYEDLRLAEALVHEFHHNELNVLLQTESIIEPVEGELYYSPWRDDPRPLQGLFHAVYVFSGVIAFLRAVEKAPDLASHRDEVQARRWQIWHQLRVGLAQIPASRLGPVGEQIIAETSQRIEAQRDDFAAAEPPASLGQHLRLWAERNPDLADRRELSTRLA